MNLNYINESYAYRDECLDFIPEHFKKDMPSVLTGSGIEVRPASLDFSYIKIPFWQFSTKSDVIISTKPVSVKIWKGESLFFAENENLCVFATGDNKAGAIASFCEQLVHFYRHYTKLRDDQVTGEAFRLRKIYKSVFRKSKISK